ncbi:MAG: helix-hairpin-helix domain-containing protein [Candidatus Gastranaerophilales bacterium]|nr:helix-hairpin-helix domain-containing protein [Candidatus Gastranaerophilales bacterium]MCM1072975.1 helix-hairpin-helix domain-containing protein [Bacteroides sp.]
MIKKFFSEILMVICMILFIICATVIVHVLLNLLLYLGVPEHIVDFLYNILPVFVLLFIFGVYSLISTILNRRIVKERKKRLKQLYIFLEPYDNIWKYLKLKNKFVRVELKCLLINLSDEKTLCKIKTSTNDNIQPCFDMICDNFNSKTTFNDLFELIKKSKFYTDIKYEISIKSCDTSIEKIDINNCSELELTSLPGINIALAKRIIKQRNVIKGFKNKVDFLEFLNIKPHLTEQIKSNIKIKKRRILKPMKLFKERQIDL